MSISKCMICSKNRRALRKYHHLFPSDCIGCSTENWQSQNNSTEKWQEICLAPRKVDHDKNSQSSDTESPEPTVPTQYLQIGYRPCKQHWGTKAVHIFSSFIRRKSSLAQNTSEQSKTSSELPSGIETTQTRSETDCKNTVLVEVKPTKEDEPRALIIPSSKTDERSETRVIGPANENFDGQESSLDVLALMQLSVNHPVPASDQTLPLKCCCSDADLTKPSMCGDRACVTCSVLDHRLIARQVSMAAEAAAQAAASVLAVPQVQTDQVSYTSPPTTPGNNADVQSVLHSVRSALESRLRYHRSELLNQRQISQTDHAESATCTTPLTQDSAVKPILLTLGKMYQKNLYISALLHNLSTLDVKKLVCLVNECRIKIEQLEEVCKQKNESALAVEQRKQLGTVDVAVGEGEVDKQWKTETVDVAVGEEDVGRKEKLDKETQENTEIDKIDSQTETANFGVEAGVQMSGDQGERTSGVRRHVDSIGSEDQWGTLSQKTDLSTADIHSRDYCHSYLLDSFLMLENSRKPKNSFPEIPLSSSDQRQDVAAHPKAYTISSQKLRQLKPFKHPSQPPIRPPSLLSHSPGRLRSTIAPQASRSPTTHPMPRQQQSTVVSARFAGGRSVMNHYPLRRSLLANKGQVPKFTSTLRK